MLWLALFLLTVPVFFRGFINTFRWFYKPLNVYWEVNNGVMDAVFTLIFKLGMGIAQLTSLLFGYIRRQSYNENIVSSEPSLRNHTSAIVEKSRIPPRKSTINREDDDFINLETSLVRKSENSHFSQLSEGQRQGFFDIGMDMFDKPEPVIAKSLAKQDTGSVIKMADVSNDE